jgi:hypothetical protein
VYSHSAPISKTPLVPSCRKCLLLLLLLLLLLQYTQGLGDPVRGRGRLSLNLQHAKESSRITPSNPSCEHPPPQCQRSAHCNWLVAAVSLAEIRYDIGRRRGRIHVADLYVCLPPHIHLPPLASHLHRRSARPHILAEPRSCTPARSSFPSAPDFCASSMQVLRYAFSKTGHYLLIQRTLNVLTACAVIYQR